ncbi:MAG: 30S ribosomal protein S8 [Patescibacteria group bacterium]
MIIKLKNAQAVKKESVKIPSSNLSEAILAALAKNGFVESFEKKGKGVKKYLDVKLKYGEDGLGKIGSVKLVSKPSRRIYAGYRELRPVKSGLGLLVVSTPRGIMSGKEARKMKLGGEVLFEIW